MRRTTLALVMVSVLVASTLVFWLFQHPVARAWVALGSPPEVADRLEQSLHDLRHLARLEPDKEDEYRRRFEENQVLLQRLRVLEHSREDLLARYELVLVLLFAGGVAVVVVAWAVRHGRQGRRLERLGAALEELSRGSTDVVVGERRRDLIGRIASMVERTSRVMARDRRRLAALENLSAWQEAARRHAHEMRTPLAAANLELSRLEDLLHDRLAAEDTEVRQVVDGARQELERLRRFTQEFTAFGRLPRPRLEVRDLDRLLREFVATFDGAWPDLELVLDGSDDEHPKRTLRAAIDRDQLRQVLVNLCDNSSLARGGSGNGSRGRQRFVLSGDDRFVYLDVIDDGPGIEPTILPRLFEPYSTTRRVGEGMGLGLAICKKILLDHGGDLELAETSDRGTRFRLSLPRPDGTGDTTNSTDPLPDPSEDALETIP